jgi:hypothetical protein
MATEPILLKCLMREPPFRSLFWALFRLAPVSLRLKAEWSATQRPQYLVGLLEAADQAIRQGVPEIAAIEFGVASGRGLLILEKHAASVEQETGVRIRVFGFDTGQGHPELIGDHRDHPDRWRAGDYPMDEASLRLRLGDRTTLLIGNVSQTVPAFVSNKDNPPVGFAAFDMDLYSSTREALKLFADPKRRMLHRVPLYFDDIMSVETNAFAGERLAITEFNASSEAVKIDTWHGLERWRPFPEHIWLKQMFLAHDLEAISRYEPPSAPPKRL